MLKKYIAISLERVPALAFVDYIIGNKPLVSNPKNVLHKSVFIIPYKTP